MAIQKITASVLGNNAVTAANVAAGALSAADIADNSLTAAKLSTSTFAIDSLTVNTSDLVVDTANNRVGIGENSPENILHIKKAASGSSYSPDSNDLVIIENNSSAGIDIRTPTGDSGGILFSDTTRARGAIIYYHSLDDMYFNVAGTSGAMVLDSGGNLGIGTNEPGNKLDVYGIGRFIDASDAPLRIQSTDGTTGLRFIDPDSSMYLFYDGSGENLYWTTAVDLGIETTPKDHNSIRGIDIGYSGFFGARDTTTASNQMYILNNAWYNGTNWLSKNSGSASLMFFDEGTLYYYADDSATASGDTLTFGTSVGNNKIFSAHIGSGDGDFLVGYGAGANETAANRSVLAVQGQSTSAVVLQPGGTTQAYLLTATNDTQLVANGTNQALNLETSSNGRIRFKTGGVIRGQIDGASTQRYQHYANISVAPSVGQSTSDSSATVMIGGGLAGGSIFGQPDVTLTDNTGYGQGIFWHDEAGYGIYRTPGAWSGGDYQQLKLAWATGIIIDPSGLASGEQTYNKDYLDIRGVTRNSTGNQPGFRATNAYVTESNGRGIVKFGSVVYNQGSDFDGSTGTFTAPYDGIYIFTFNFLFSVGGVGYVRCLFALNGTPSVQYGDNLMANTGTTVISTGSSAGTYTTTLDSYMDGGLCQIFKLSANDTIKLDNQGVPLYSHTGQTTYSSFSGYFLG